MRYNIKYRSCADTGWIEYGHTLESYIGGQTKCGFAIIGFYEECEEYPCDTSFVTRAIKI